MRGGVMVATASVAAATAIGAFAAEAAPLRTYLVGGIGYMSVTGSATAAETRDPGWNFFGGIRRQLTERVTIGVSGEYGNSDLDERGFFEARDVFLSEPERHVQGGEFDVFGATVDGIYEYQADASTVVYGKIGLGYFSWSVSKIFVNTNEIGDADVPPEITFEDETGIGGAIGGGVRFPLGESAGIFVELNVSILNPRDGSMQIVPFRVGISIP